MFAERKRGPTKEYLTLTENAVGTVTNARTQSRAVRAAILCDQR